MSDCFKELKNKGKLQFGNPKSGHSDLWSGRSWEVFITKFESQFKWVLQATISFCYRLFMESET